MTDILRGAYGPWLSRSKLPALRKALHRYFPPQPTVADGKMRPDEWVRHQGAWYKTDYEHHNFGGGELDIVDPAYDLAAAIFEHDLPRDWQERLLSAYRLESGDSSISERTLLYKILYAVMARNEAADGVCRHSEKAQWNQRYLRAHNFLVFQMCRFCSNLLQVPSPAWSDRLFFLDLDGVLDSDLLGFPHTTPDGLRALTLLRSRGFSVVLNTGRSVQHVREYCQAYGLPGGIGEFGGVFVDVVNGLEVPLIRPAAALRLAQVRSLLEKIPGVCVDTGYEYSIRAYRYQGRHTVGLSEAEVRSFMSRTPCDDLTVICRQADTHIVQRNTGKGPALESIRQRLGCAARPVWAMGDSELDVGMLQAAQFAYAPSNCSPEIRKLGRASRCRVMGRAFQKGFLAAVREISDSLPQGPAGSREILRVSGSDHLLLTLLGVADRSRWSQLLNVLRWNRL